MSKNEGSGCLVFVLIIAVPMFVAVIIRDGYLTEQRRRWHCQRYASIYVKGADVCIKVDTALVLPIPADSVLRARDESGRK